MKPELKDLASYLKDHCKGCIVTADQIERLKPLYSKLNANDIDQVAESGTPMPIGLLIKKANSKMVIRFDRRQPVKRCEVATNWNAISADIKAKSKPLSTSEKKELNELFNELDNEFISK